MQTVLVMEKDTATLVAWALVLRSFGFTVLEAASRGEAWRACHLHRRPVDLILTKAASDNGTSDEFVSRLQLMCPRMRAVFVCDALSAELAGRLSMPCEYAVVRKPFRAEVLADTITGLLDGSMGAASSLS
ncbi:MAG TPA: hypothetical protein VLX58_07175 [Bryobacteraceae bacterium]|nr:hypothetical protein [Bryobacteraceae bacterium]